MKKFLFLAILTIAGLSSCKSSKTVTDNTSNTTQSDAVENRTQQRPGGGERGQRGGRDRGEMFTRMDVNKDGKLTKDELRGPMVDRFEVIDTNKDGSISLEELKAAPRPQRGQRPNGGGGK